MPIYVNNIIHKNFVDPKQTYDTPLEQKSNSKLRCSSKYQYVGTTDRSTDSRFGIISAAQYEAILAEHTRGQRGRWDGPLLFSIVENVVKEPVDTLILEHIQTVDNVQHFKTMSMRGTSTGKGDSYYNSSVKDFIPKKPTTCRKLNECIIGYEEEITITLR